MNTQLDSRQNDGDDEIDIGALFGILAKNKWLIASATIVGLTLGLATAFVQTPVYKTGALIKVQPPAGADTKSAVLTESEDLKSRAILREAVTKLKLDIQTKPQYYPGIGEALARKFNDSDAQTIAEPMFNKTEYAWGGEVIELESLSVPESWLGAALTLVAGAQNHYRLMKGTELLLEGEVGKPAEKFLDSQRENISILVSRLIARPDTRFSVVKQAQDSVIDQLQSGITAAEKGKGTGVMELSLESADPKSAMRTLNELIDLYLKKNVGTKSTEVQKTSDLLDKQIAALKSKIDASTTELDDYKSKNHSVDIGIEMQRLSNDISNIKGQISQLQLKHDELRQKFTESHPYVETLNKQIRRLNEALQTHTRSIEALPQAQQVIEKLTKEIKVNSDLYTTLLNSAQSKRVDKEITVEKATVIDYAQLAKSPIRPNKPLILAIASLLGLLLGVITAFVRHAMNKGVSDPGLIEKQLGVHILTAVPHSKEELKLDPSSKNKAERLNRPYILALENKEEAAIESLRNLRTTLHFTLSEAKNKVLMITGPSPGIGKSFISLNLATLFADSGKKVLLIDADMRKGRLNRALGLRREHGLSELISNQIAFDQAMHHIPDAKIDFIATGVLPPNPSELLLTQRFIEFLNGIDGQYDHIIIDSPPVLAVTDAVIIGRMAAATLMVVKEGQHSMDEIEQSIKRLSQAGVDLKGIVFNDYKRSNAQSGYGAGSYAYQYNYTRD